MGPDIALAASAREWPDRLHRHLLDHGGGRVVGRIMGADQVLDLPFDVMLIDDVCSFLTPRLVTIVKQRGSDVVGVFASEDGSDAKRRLLECGISDVIEMDAEPVEFLDKISSTISHRPPTAAEPAPKGQNALSIGVAGAIDGAGVTEVATALAGALANSLRVVLVDLDTTWPSIAQRLDLPLHPNLRTVLDAAMHDPDRMVEGIHRRGALSVIGGLADAGRGAPLGRVEVSTLFDLLAPDFDVVVSDLGPSGRSLTGVMTLVDTLIAVGTADPVGVGRLLRTLESILAASSAASILAVVNKTPRGSFYSSEVRRELSTAFPTVPVVCLPEDGRISPAAWEGTPVSGGPFVKAIRRIAALVTASLAS